MRNENSMNVWQVKCFCFLKTKTHTEIEIWLNAMQKKIRFKKDFARIAATQNNQVPFMK